MQIDRLEISDIGPGPYDVQTEVELVSISRLAFYLREWCMHDKDQYRALGIVEAPIKISGPKAITIDGLPPGRYALVEDMAAGRLVVIRI